jgi:hypothetical protein
MHRLVVLALTTGRLHWRIFVEMVNHSICTQPQDKLPKTKLLQLGYLAFQSIGGQFCRIGLVDGAMRRILAIPCRKARSSLMRDLICAVSRCDARTYLHEHGACGEHENSYPIKYELNDPQSPTKLTKVLSPKRGSLEAGAKPDRQP